MCVSLSPDSLSHAACDQHAFYAFRDLLTGQIHSYDDLTDAERFVRAAVLHDSMSMEGEPHPAPEEEHEWTDEEKAAGGRNVITAFMPTLDGYEALISSRLGPHRPIAVELSDDLVRLAEEHSGATGEDPYYRSHIRYLQTLVLVLKRGGSLVCKGAVGSALMDRASEC